MEVRLALIERCESTKCITPCCVAVNRLQCLFTAENVYSWQLRIRRGLHIRMHNGKKESQWRQCNALAMFCQETLDITIHVNVTLNVYPFMESVFPNGSGLSFSRITLSECKNNSRLAWEMSIKVLIWLPYSSDINPVKQQWHLHENQAQSNGGPTLHLIGLKGSVANTLVPDSA